MQCLVPMGHTQRKCAMGLSVVHAHAEYVCNATTVGDGPWLQCCNVLEKSWQSSQLLNHLRSFTREDV
jgi:hypothetical protein